MTEAVDIHVNAAWTEDTPPHIMHDSFFTVHNYFLAMSIIYNIHRICALGENHRLDHFIWFTCLYAQFACHMNRYIDQFVLPHSPPHLKWHRINTHSFMLSLILRQAVGIRFIHGILVWRPYTSISTTFSFAMALQTKMLLTFHWSHPSSDKNS